MPFTSPQLVRAHLSGLRAGTLPIANVPVVLTGASAVPLPHSGLADDSVTVKAIRLSAPVREQITLASDWVALTHTNLVQRSIVLSDDESLGTIYVENADYLVDYALGRVKRIATGAIPPDHDVVVWYDHYHVYIEGDDYTVDYTNGLLTRNPSGEIADGQTVLIDYTVALGTLTDDAIENAIAEVDEAILAILDPQYQDRAVPGIVIAETHWAIAAICRTRAAATLIESASASASAHNTARAWLDLADQYDRSGRERLRRFAAPHASLRTPRRN
jgi:hypothetical protein